MADQKISALTPKAAPVSGDTTVIVDSVGGLNKKITLGTLPVSTPIQTAIDAKVTDAIVDGVTTVAPSQNAVFDALATKQTALGFTPEDVANKDNGALSTSITTYPTSGAVKTAVDLKGDITNIQTFTSSGTWTKPAGNPKYVDVFMRGASAGGGSGRRGAAGTARCGGGGGAGGGLIWVRLLASDVGATEAVVIGSGGAGAPAILTDDTNGDNGQNGGNSTFGTMPIIQTTFTNFGRGGGAGVSGAGGTANGSTSFGAVGQTAGLGSAAAGAAGAAGTNVIGFQTMGGASGAGIPTTNITFPGGQGGRTTSLGYMTGLSAATAGVVDGGNGGNGTLADTKFVSIPIGGSGASGGSSITSAAGAGGNGAGGSGGGGGAASANGFASGAGGAGTDGMIVVITTY
jgi:hypothetical protein